MRIYVAGRWTRKEQVREVIAMLRYHEHTITFDWTQMPDTEDEEELRRNALIDIGAVVSAQAVILLYDEGGKGMWVEMGAALASGVQVCVVGAPKHGVFEYHPLVTRVETVEQALEWAGLVLR